MIKGQRNGYEVIIDEHSHIAYCDDVFFNTCFNENKRAPDYGKKYAFCYIPSYESLEDFISYNHIKIEQTENNPLLLLIN